MGAVDGQGTTITHGTTGFAASLISVSGPDQERGSIETTHMGTTGAKTFVPADIYDGGEFETSIVSTGAVSPPIGQPAETITIDWGGQGAGYRTSFSGFMLAFSISASMGERLTGTARWKVTGAVTHAA